jgi:hypothetical protein
MENIKQSVMPESMWAEDPKLAQQCQDVFDYLKQTPFSKAFPNKYKAITKTDAKVKTYELFLLNPNMPLKSVVSTVLEGLDNDLSSKLVLDMARVIVEKWGELTAQTVSKMQVAELV